MQANEKHSFVSGVSGSWLKCGAGGSMGKTKFSRLVFSALDVVQRVGAWRYKRSTQGVSSMQMKVWKKHCRCVLGVWCLVASVWRLACKV